MEKVCQAIIFSARLRACWSLPGVMVSHTSRFEVLCTVLSAILPDISCWPLPISALCMAFEQRGHIFHDNTVESQTCSRSQKHSEPVALLLCLASLALSTYAVHTHGYRSRAAIARHGSWVSHPCSCSGLAVNKLPMYRHIQTHTHTHTHTHTYTHTHTTLLYRYSWSRAFLDSWL